MKSPFGLPDRKNSDTTHSKQIQPAAGSGISGQAYPHITPSQPMNLGFVAEDDNRPTAAMTSQNAPGEERFAQANIPTRPLAGHSPYQPPRPPKKQPPLAARILILVLMIALLGSGGWALVNIFARQSEKTSAPPTPVFTEKKPITTSQPGQAAVSPLIFGTNLELYNAKDQALTSAKTRQLLQQINAGIIRMPMRNDGTLEPEKQAAQMIKDLGATPLVILHGEAVVKNALQEDIKLINEINRIFGDKVVYYEYGNEEDLQGIDKQKYTDSWNKVVPQLKKAARNGHFIGPVNYQYNNEYLQYFLKNANPRPDEVSWHEYTCDKSWAKEKCIQNIDKWTKHIADARATMKATVGTELPIMITEWNYAPNPTLGDGKISDQAFMKTWTEKAFQTLAANRIFASMIYAATHPVIPLIASNETLTTQGNLFKSEYQSIITQGKVPPPAQGVNVADQPTPATDATGNEKAVYTFENGGVENWTASSQSISGVSQGDIARSGQGSLKVGIQRLNRGDSSSVMSNVSPPDAPSRGGQSVAGYVYLTSNSVSLEAKMVVVDGNNTRHIGDTVTLTPGRWNRVALTLPSSFNGSAKQVGIQFSTPSDNVIGTNVYIDDIGWN